MIVVVSGEAKADIEAIGDYIAHDSPTRAQRFVKELQEKCLDLAEMPAAFPLIPR